MLDTPWKIATLVAALLLFRIAVGALKTIPHRSFLVELANSALVAFLLVFLLVRPLLLQAFFIPSGSMEPTLHGDPRLHRWGDRILVNKFIYRLGAPRRGDIVVFRAPQQAFLNHARIFRSEGGAPDYIKRVIGLPGERVKIVSGVGVFINGDRLYEPYLKEPPYYDWPRDENGAAEDEPYIVPADSILVLGDNRNESNDSSRWQDPDSGKPKPALPLKNVLGRALIIFWPPERIGRLTR